MPHSLIELNAMSEEQLRSIAEALNIKGAKKLDRAGLGFAILDQEAIAESQKPAQEPKPRKRGRPRKEESAPKADASKAKADASKAKADAPQKEEKPRKEEVQAAAAAETPASQPKKRGRKPKNAVKPAEEAPAPAVTEESASAPAPEKVDGKEFIHNLFDDLKEDEAQKEDKRVSLFGRCSRKADTADILVRDFTAVQTDGRILRQVYKFCRAQVIHISHIEVAGRINLE